MASIENQLGADVMRTSEAILPFPVGNVRRANQFVIVSSCHDGHPLLTHQVNNRRTQLMRVIVYVNYVGSKILDRLR
jgi:hypothetical protein